jgi:hypothetical protein
VSLWRRHSRQLVCVDGQYDLFGFTVNAHSYVRIQTGLQLKMGHAIQPLGWGREDILSKITTAYGTRTRLDTEGVGHEQLLAWAFQCMKQTASRER